LNSYRKFDNPANVKEKFSNFLNELETICRNLQLGVTSSDGLRNEMMALEDDEKIMTKFLGLFEEESEFAIKSGTVFEEIWTIREKISKDEMFELPHIPPTHLTKQKSQKLTDSRGK
ncbi:2848_t:CDS:2, partial [Acaulospora colombiana]